MLIDSSPGPTKAGGHHLYEWFHASAIRYADEPALEVGAERLTYRSLAQRAGELTDALRQAGVTGRPTRVGLLAGRSVAAYAGYLAVQRLGATVVPLNPAFPPARNAAIAAAAGLEVILSEQGTLPGCTMPTVAAAVDPQAPEFGKVPELPQLDRSPDDLAYILFTSGSTGRPKGVPITHRNLSSYLTEVIPRYHTGPGCRLSQAFDLTFDVSVFDMFVAWGSGATLVVPTADELLAPVGFISSRAITHWCSVPSIISFTRRMRALRERSMPTLRYSVFAGEPLTLQQAEAWQRAAPQSRIDNLYGPTEATVTCAGYRLPANPAQWPRSANDTVPIGIVHSGVEQLVLDEDGRPAGKGELCLRGPQRFPGYLDPTDDAGRFVRVHDGVVTELEPEDQVDQGCWYRTGDRVGVYDGTLVHLGRLDQQVKVHGYRVELGEVEATLRTHPGVGDAVVLAHPDDRGDTDLYAVCTGTAPPDELIAGLRTRLPAYMVPREVTVVDCLPLNANGKTDRRALSEQLARAMVR
ncbi:amino acid adenylation domain-containing protein [Salinispora arenicola]|uniref:amino acid adenylation domain-containing protein n=1 Tax=Salinispora arenicola TaxID=168697 RepID=UPI0004867687|nr:amino acid adenylation domain-containing protein [Salinispora arenicola]